MMNRLIGLLLVLSALLWQGCATTSAPQKVSADQKEPGRLRAKLKADSTNAEAWRELGVIYFKSQQYPRAKACLKNAYRWNSQDPKARFYLGLAFEFENRGDLALKLYEGYSRVSRLSPYRKLLAGRYQLLTRQTIQAELRTLLQQEQRLSTTSVSPKCVAVFPFRYLGRDKKFLSLGRGLSEMMITDLGKVRELKLLERLRLQILVDEIALSQTEGIDKNSAPRFGKLLGAGRIIAGTYNVLPSERVQLEILSWDIANRQVPAATSTAEALKNLFRLEKDLVFTLIAKMGIELTPQEREKIQLIPTKNLQAFMAYCQALEKEDAGQFNAALQLYQKAMQLDPGFSSAKTKAEAAESLSLAGGSKEQTLAAAQAMENSSAAVTSRDLVEVRLQNLAGSIGSNFMSGQDTREPAEEADLSGAGLGGTLSKPLPPPK